MAYVIRGVTEDGWRYRVDCTHECGRTCVVVAAHIRTAACAVCLREKHGALIDYRGNGERGVSWPSARVSTGVVSLRKSRVVLTQEVDASDERVWPQPRALAGRIEGARLLLSIARRADSPITAAGKPSANWSKTDTLISVQWRVNGRPPTCIAIWKNGKRDTALMGSREMTHTEIGAL